MAAPANDNWANALAISFTGSTGVSPSISTAESTFEAGEVIPSGWDVGNKSIWFSYTPLASGTANFDTQLSTPVSAGTDTEMAVYTGTALASLTKVANNSDAGGNNTSLITGFAVTGGVTYWIQVGPFTGADINIVLRIAGPATALPPSATYASAVLAYSPFAYYRLGDVSGSFVDSSGNGKTLASQATAPTYGTPGAIDGDPNTAITFAGDSEFLNITGGGDATRSLIAWAKAGSHGTIRLLTGTYFYGNGNVYFDLRINTDGTAQGKVNGVTITGPVITDNEWHMLVLTFATSGTITLYVDGAQVATAGGASIQSVSDRLFLSGLYGSNRHVGALDEVAFITSTLTGPEVAALYAIATLGTPGPPPVFVARSSTGQVMGGGTVPGHATAVTGDLQQLAIVTHASITPPTPSGWTLVGRRTTAHSGFTLFERIAPAGQATAGVALTWGDRGKATMRTYHDAASSSIGASGTGLVAPSRVVASNEVLVRWQSSALDNNSFFPPTMTMAPDANLIHQSGSETYDWFGGLADGQEAAAAGQGGTVAPSRTATHGATSGFTVTPQFIDVIVAGIVAGPAQVITLGRVTRSSVARPVIERPPPASVPWIKASLELVGEQWQKSAPIVGPFPQFVQIRRVSTPPRIAYGLTVIRGVRVLALGRAIRASTARPWVVAAEQPIGYYADEVLSSLPEVFWRMEDGPDIPDHSGNGRTGFFDAWSNYQGLGVTKKIPGITGYGQRFDDYEVRYYDPDDFTLTVNFTIECWYQSTWTRSNGTYAMVNVASHQKAIGVQETPSGSGNTFLYARFGQSSSSTRTNVAPYSLVNDGQWHHLVLTRAGGSVRFYVDTVQTYASDVESAYTPSTYVEIYTGSYYPRVTDPISPGLDEVAYYDHALTLSEVRRHYRSALERGDPPQAKSMIIGRALSQRVVQRLIVKQNQVYFLGRASRTSITRPLTKIQGPAPGSPQFIALGRVVRADGARTLVAHLKFDQVATLGRVVRASSARGMIFSSGILFSDSFNRPDGQLGTAEIGGPYAYPYAAPNNHVTVGGAYGVTSNQGAQMVTWPAAADFDTTLRLRQVGGDSWFMFRYIDNSNYWKVAWKSADRTMALIRKSGSTETAIGTAAYLGDYVNGFLTPTIRVIGRGRFISVYLEGRMIIQAEDFHVQGTIQAFYFNSDNITRIESVETRRLVPVVVPDFDWIETELALIVSASNHDGLIFKGRDSRQADEGLMA